MRSQYQQMAGHPKVGGKLPPTFATQNSQPKPQPYEKFVRLTGTWLKGEYKLYAPFARRRDAS